MKNQNTLKKIKPIVISYLRWSSGQQRSGDSERRQLKEVTEYLDKHGYTINEDYILRDDGKSGYHSENFLEDGALGQFIKQVKAGKIPKGTILIIEDFSRFSRAKVNLAQERFLQLINNGIRVYIAKDRQEYNQDNYDTVNMIVSLSKMSSAHDESQRKSDYLKDFWENARKLAASASASKPNNYPALLPSTPPSWIRKVKKDGEYCFEPIPTLVEVIKYIFHLAIDGGLDGLGMGSTLIVRQLEKEGIKPFDNIKKNKAVTFNDSYVVRLLKDERLLGYLQPYKNPINTITGKRERIKSGKKIANYFPAVIDMKTFKKARSKIKKRKEYTAGRVSKTFSNLFTNIVKCSYCGHSMTMFTKKGSVAEGGRSVYLQCSEGTKHQKCGNRAVRYYDTFEMTIIQSLTEMNLSHLFEPSTHKSKAELHKLKQESDSIELELSKMDEIIKEASKQCFRNAGDNYFKEARAELIEERDHLAEHHERLKSKIFEQREGKSHKAFKDNLSYVLKSNLNSDDVQTYNIRRSINTYLKDLVQYIAVDGVHKKAWVVFKKEHIIRKIEQATAAGREWLSKKINEGTTELYLNSSSNGDFNTFGFFPLHIELFLHRFNSSHQIDISELRTSHETAPRELIKINRTLNEAINRSWKKNKKLKYEILSDSERNKVYEQFAPEYSEAHVAELQKMAEDFENEHNKK